MSTETKPGYCDRCDEAERQSPTTFTDDNTKYLDLRLPDPSTMISNLEQTAYAAGVRAERARWAVSDTDLTTNFANEWKQAPRSMRNYVEESVAEYWYRRGWTKRLKEPEGRR